METNPNDGKTIWNVVYSFTETDAPLDGMVRTRVFDREDFALDWLKRDYENALSECRDEDAPHDVIDCGINGNHASILVGDGDTEEVEYVHRWELHRNTLNYGV